ncbi:FtsQ-type POTRA domain-containing protein, partial [bacterium]
FLLVAVLFVGQLGFAAFTAPQFEIKTVAITGAIKTPHALLHPIAQKLVGQNLLRADRQTIEKAVEKLPTVASARVARLPVWPPKVQLQIEERQPVLRVGAGNDWWVIDSQGVAFRRAGTDDSHLYQVVAPEFAPRQGRKLDPRAWSRAAALNAALKDDNRIVAEQTPGESQNQDAFWKLRRIYFDKNGLASLRLTNHGNSRQQNEMLLRLGDDHWKEKLARARVALSYFEKTGRRAQELDLVSLERPVWRPVPSHLDAGSDETSGENLVAVAIQGRWQGAQLDFLPHRRLFYLRRLARHAAARHPAGPCQPAVRERGHSPGQSPDGQNAG